MKRFVLLVMFLTVQGIIGFPQIRLNPCNDTFDYPEKNISDSKLERKIKSLCIPKGNPELENIPISFFAKTDLNNVNELSTSLRTFYHFNNMLYSLFELTKAVGTWINKDCSFIPKEQSIPINTASSNKTQVQVTSSAPDEHTTLVNDHQFTSVKTEKMKDNKKKKEKLKDNKKPVTSKSTVSSNVPKKNMKPKLAQRVSPDAGTRRPISKKPKLQLSKQKKH